MIRFVGSRSVFTWTIRDEAGALYAPPIQLFKLKPPPESDGDEETFRFGVDPELTSPSLGSYRIEVPWVSAGNWKARIEALSNATDPKTTLYAREFECRVTETAFVNPILP